MPRNKKKKQLQVITFVSLIVFVCCILYIVHYYSKLNAADKDYQEIQKQTTATTQNENVTEAISNKETISIEEITENVTSEVIEYDERMEVVVEPADIPIDFKELQKRNPDVYAWINIPNTPIDYPIVQSKEDNSYYLNHTIDGTPGLPGSIYTENYNSKDFTDSNTVIYGHRMNNETMFSSLHVYRDQLFFDENPYITIYTPSQILIYQIFATYLTDDKHIMLSFDFDNPAVFQRYLDEVFSIRSMDALFNKEIDVTADNHIITLSTCSVDNVGRLLVQAVLIEEE